VAASDFQKSTDINGSETVDLGIKGRRAIVCASSKGLGRACAMALANEGVHVTLTARGAEVLKKTADEIRKASPGVTVTEIVGDITTPQGREDVLKACPEPDILINNAGGPAARRFPQLDPRRLDQGGRRQHADADRADQGHRGRHDGAQIRPHRPTSPPPR
jgi:NAD(P)-dependent dehydrogenase (short-subunit alcohol dehydrogenase family)